MHGGESTLSIEGGFSDLVALGAGADRDDRNQRAGKCVLVDADLSFGRPHPEERGGRLLARPMKLAGPVAPGKTKRSSTPAMPKAAGSVEGNSSAGPSP